VEQGRSGRCWPGWGRPGTAGAGRGRARPGRRQLGAERVVCGRGGSGVRRGQSGTSQGGWGRAPPTWGRVRRQHEEQLVAAAVRVAIQHMEEMREREAGERKDEAGYTRLCSSGRHINRRT
jgi:hypothetical protein